MTNTQSSNHHSLLDVGIVGGGIIGLSCAFELATRGVRVSVYDQNQLGRGASWAAAGMLAPAYEAAAVPGTHPGLFDLCMSGVEIWPGFAARLSSATSEDIGFRGGPALAVATTDEEASRLRLIADALSASGCEFELMSAQSARTIEPALSGYLQDALLLPTDGQVDNRRVMLALIKFCRESEKVTVKEGTGVSDPVTLHKYHDAVICAAGWQSAKYLGLAETISPVSGQMLSVERLQGVLNHTIRSGAVYIAPKHDRVVIGATVEPQTVRTKPDPESIRALLAAASHICPALKTAPIIETWSGVRPATTDHAPVIGRVGARNMFVATGHYRNGILLAPITANMICDDILGLEENSYNAAFSPSRFILAQV